MKKQSKTYSREVQTHINALWDEIDTTSELRRVAKAANKDISEHNKWLTECRAKLRELENS